jgi:hypothetical protein
VGSVGKTGVSVLTGITVGFNSGRGGQVSVEMISSESESETFKVDLGFKVRK